MSYLEDEDWDFRMGRLVEHEDREITDALLRGKRARLAPRLRWTTIYASTRPVTATGGTTFTFQHYTISKTPPVRRTREGTRRAGHEKSRARRARHEAARYQLYIQRADLDHAERLEEIYSDADGFVDFGSFSTTPEEAASMWRALEEIERSDGCVQSRLVLELPHELSRTEDGRDGAYREILDRFSSIISSRGLPVHVTAHLPDVGQGSDERNFHAHLVYSERPVERKGEGNWEFAAKKDRSARGRVWISMLRSSYADIVNDVLERESAAREMRGAESIARRYDPSRYQDVGIAKEPGQHLGPGRTALERAGWPTREGLQNALVEDRYRVNIKPVADRLIPALALEAAVAGLAAGRPSFTVELELDEAAPVLDRRRNYENHLAFRADRLLTGLDVLERRERRRGEAENSSRALLARLERRRDFLSDGDAAVVAASEEERVSVEQDLAAAGKLVERYHQPERHQRCAERLQRWMEQEVDKARRGVREIEVLECRDRIGLVQETRRRLKRSLRAPDLEQFRQDVNLLSRQFAEDDKALQQARDDLRAADEVERRAEAMRRRQTDIEERELHTLLLLATMRPPAIGRAFRLGLHLADEKLTKREVELQARLDLLASDPAIRRGRPAAIPPAIDQGAGATRRKTSSVEDGGRSI